MLRTVSIIAAIVAPVMAAGGLAGCQTTRQASPLITEYDQADARAELAFWHGLAAQPITTHNDAFHGLIELARGEDPFAGYEQRVQWLKEQKLLDEGFQAPADAAVTRGTVAQVLVNILDIDGGLTMRLFGAHPRYATRELVYLDIMERGTNQQALAGIQFVTIIGRASDYQGVVP